MRDSDLSRATVRVLAWAAVLSVAAAWSASAAPHHRARHSSGKSSHAARHAHPAGRVATISAPSAPAARTRSLPGGAGMVVGVDDNGHLGMPSPAQRAELGLDADPNASRQMAELEQVYHPDGSVSMMLDSRFEEFAIVRMAPGGKLLFDCVADPKAALQKPAPVAPAPVKAEEE